MDSRLGGNDGKWCPVSSPSFPRKACSRDDRSGNPKKNERLWEVPVPPFPFRNGHSRRGSAGSYFAGAVSRSRKPISLTSPSIIEAVSRMCFCMKGMALCFSKSSSLT